MLGSSSTTKKATPAHRNITPFTPCDKPPQVVLFWPPMATDEQLPSWANELRRRYLRGESSQFVLHGNVHDLILHAGKLFSLSEFLSQVLLEKKDTVLLYNVSTGVRFAKKKM